MGFIAALFAVVGFVSGLISIYLFVTSRTGTQTHNWSIFGIIGAAILLATLFLTYFSSNTSTSSQSRLSNLTTPQLTATPTLSPPSLTPTLEPSPTPILTPTPPSFPKPGTVLYQEDGSDNWQGWSGDQAWKVLSHFLLNDGTSDDFSRIIAPYQVEGTADYAVEARFQVISYEHRVSYPCFGIAVRGMSTAAPTRGYHGVIGCFSDLTDIELQDDEKTLATAPFDPGNSWHTYRIEVKGNNIKFFVDGGLKIVLTDNKFLDGGEVGLFDTQVQLNISNFKIITL